ncbi:MAG TPA: TetR/AcrR family transcriptional regulator [Polyangiaceae bacterium]
MARAALSQADVEVFRENTVRAATRLFASQGYAAVTMRAIASELGTSPMAPYRYFQNKSEIFAMVRAEAYRRFADAQAEAFAAPAANSLERLVTMRDAYVRFALDHPDEYRVMFELHQEPEERYPSLARESHRAFASLEEAARRAIAEGVLAGEPTTVAHLLWSSLHGMVSLHLAGKLTLGRPLEELLASPPLRMLLPGE